MISIEEPTRREYSEEESRLLKHKFITFLYVLLIVYLTLHQFLIPFVSNIFKGNNLASDIHWFFIIHFFGYYQLKKTKKMSFGFYCLLWVITIAQCTVGFLTFGKWGLFSLAITQTSTVIFLYFVWPFVSHLKETKTILAHVVVGLIIFTGLNFVEIHSPEMKRSTERRLILHQEDFAINLPGQFPTNRELSVWKLSNQVIEFDREFKIVNDKDSIIDIRLYELKIKSNRVGWKYKRLSQLKPGEAWNLPLQNDHIYLIKSPERRDLKVLLLIPKGYQFPLGKGVLSVGFNSLEWRGEEA